MTKSVLGGIVQRFTNLTTAFVIAASSMSLALPMFMISPVSATAGSTSISDADFVVDKSVASDGTLIDGKPTYQSIAAAVSAASPNSTVVVRDGVYNETNATSNSVSVLSLNIPKSKNLKLKAEHKHEAIITVPVIMISTGAAAIDGFSIKLNNSTTIDYGIWIDHKDGNSNGASVTNNMISGITSNTKGVKGILSGDSTQTYRNFTVSNNTISGVNSSSKQTAGVLLNGTATNANVTNNTISNITGPDARGIAIETKIESNASTVTNNTFNLVSKPVYVQPFSPTTLAGNIVLNAKPTGLKTVDAMNTDVTNGYTSSPTITNSWTKVVSATSYNYEFSKPAGYPTYVRNNEVATSVSGEWHSGVSPEGKYSFRVQANFGIGVTSEWSDTSNATYDKTPPSISYVAPAYNNQVLTSSNNIEVEFSDMAELKQVTVHGYKDGTMQVPSLWQHPLVNGKTKTISLPLTGLADGTYQIRAAAEDEVGNIVRLNRTFSIDSTGPTITVQPSSIGSEGIYSKVGFNFYDVNKIDHITINEIVKPLTPDQWSNVDDIGNPYWYGATEGLNTLVAYDTLGNSTTLKFTIDRTAPSVVSYAYSNNGNVTQNNVKVTITTSEPVEIPTDWTKVDDTHFTKVFEYNGGFNIDLKDLAGNTAHVGGKAQGAEVKGIDRNAPEISGVTNGSTVNSPVHLSIFDPKTGGYADGFDKLHGLKVNAQEVPTTDGAGKTYLYDIAADGVYTVTATDKAGNSTTITFIIDSIAPVVTITGPATANIGDSPVVRGTVDDPTITEVKIFVNGINVGTALVNGGAWTFPLSELVTPIGTRVITASAVDTAGNSSTPVAISIAVSQPPITLTTLQPIQPAPATSGTSTISVAGAATRVAILGDSTTAPADGSVLAAETGTVDNSNTTNNDNSKDETAEKCGGFLGLCWYWWVAIVVGIVAIYYIVRSSGKDKTARQ